MGNVYSSYFDTSNTKLPIIENTIAYLFEDDKQIIYLSLIKDGQSYQMKKQITFKDGSISQEEKFFLEDHHSVKDRIWNLYYYSFSSSEIVKVHMKHHTMCGDGEYTLTLKGTTIDIFKSYINNDSKIVQNLIDFKRYITLMK